MSEEKAIRRTFTLTEEAVDALKQGATHLNITQNNLICLLATEMMDLQKLKPLAEPFQKKSSAVAKMKQLLAGMSEDERRQFLKEVQ